jgi:dTDP-glucose 4,6-dehydratase
MGNIAATKQGLHFVTARLFAFIAPFLPLGTHFAAGNFIRDAVTSNQIEIQSGGGSIRSYLYGSDLCGHLWALLNRGRNRNAYNVGSGTETSIFDLACAVASKGDPGTTVHRLGEDTIQSISRYVPSVRKIEDELGITSLVSLEESVIRTILWLRQSKNT